MSNIHILPDDLVNKIAAGEVVERPASVVKELLDNAYDSGANQITIEIEEGGTKKIYVGDNGSGMDKEDVELAFKPHATSKISSQDDLLNIKNYGFRGEALSSIASVSKVTLKSRRQSDNLGNEIKIEGGNTTHFAEAGGPVGTSVLVEDLFYNVPARREFIKSVQSEYRAILEIVDAHAIANPKIGLILKNNGKIVYSLPKDHQLEDRVRVIMGKDFNDKLIPLFFEHPHLEVYGYVAKPELASERNKNQYIFVNRRHITNKSISFAVKSAYESLIPKNVYPPYLVFIDVAPNIVDVNVHPRKEEVKFSDEQLIFNSIKSAVKGALDRANLTPGSAPANNSPFGNQFASPFGKPSPFGTMPPRSPAFGSQNRANSFSPSNRSPFPVNSQPQADPFWDSQYDNDPFSQNDQSMNQQALNSNKKVLQLHNLYLVTESESGIMVYDQHALHERILYEQLINANKAIKDEKNTQGLLTPVVINLSTQEASVVEEYLEDFKSAGFELEEFGPSTYKINQVPAPMVGKDINAITHELISDLEKDEKIKDTDSESNKMLTYLSCRMAYKAGDVLPQEEAVALIDQIPNLKIEYTCPHGRPLKIEFTLEELAKLFKRS